MGCQHLAMAWQCCLQSRKSRGATDIQLAAPHIHRHTHYCRLLKEPQYISLLIIFFYLFFKGGKQWWVGGFKVLHFVVFFCCCFLSLTSRLQVVLLSRSVQLPSRYLHREYSIRTACFDLFILYGHEPDRLSTRYKRVWQQVFCFFWVGSRFSWVAFYYGSVCTYI